jgi:hypothetical protein
LYPENRLNPNVGSDRGREKLRHTAGVRRPVILPSASIRLGRDTSQF